MKMIGLPLVAAPTQPECLPSHTAGLEAWCEFRRSQSTHAWISDPPVVKAGLPAQPSALQRLERTPH
jgi:hypothetical protein